MGFKVLSTEATLRMMNLVRDGAPPPIKIVEHQARKDAVEGAAERRYRSSGGVIEQPEMKCLLNMRLELEALYTDWAKRTERIRWIDIPLQDDITPEIVVRECVMSTESYFGNKGVEVLAAYLDACGYNNLLSQLGEACVMRVREYLTGVIPRPTFDTAVLDKPAEHYGIVDRGVLRNRLVDRFALFVHSKSSQHVIRALVANIEWGIGNPMTAISEAGFAYYEATVEQFGLKLEMKDDPDVERAFTDWELWKAAQLLSYLK